MNIINKQINSFVKNYGVYTFGVIGLRACSFILIPLYTNILRLEEYGKLVTIFSIIQILIIFMNFGSRISMLRFASECELNNELGKLVWSSTAINIIGGLFVYLICNYFFISTFENILHQKDIYNIVALMCFAALAQSLLLHIISYYRATNNGVWFAGTGLCVAVLLSVTTFIFMYKYKLGLEGALIAQVVSYGVGFLFSAFHIFSKVGGGGAVGFAFKLLLFGFPLVFSLSGGVVMDAFAIFLLSNFLGLKQVAIYSLGYKIAQIATLVLVQPFQLAYLPFVYSNIEAPNLNKIISRILTYFTVAFTIVAILIVLIFRDMMFLISPPEYYSAYYLVFVFLPVFSFSIIRTIGESLLHAKNKTYVTGLIVVIVTIFNMLFNYMLIKKIGFYGSIITFCITNLSLPLVLIYFGIKEFHVKIEKKRIIVLMLFMYIGMIFIFLINNQNYINFYIASIIIISIGVFLISKLGFFDESEISFIINLKNKLLGKLVLTR